MPLPSAFVSDFSEPQWVSVPLGGDAVEMLLKPLSWDDYLTLFGKHGICLRCFGSGEINGETCRSCGGRYVVAELIPEFRLDLIRLVVHDWRGLRALDGNNNIIEVPYSERARDGLARILEAFNAIRTAAQELAAGQEQKKSSSETTQPGG